MKLLAALQHLRDIGNTVVVVEHDREAMEEADWLIDFGPGAGRARRRDRGRGHARRQVRKSKTSLTGRYLRGGRDRDARGEARPATGGRSWCAGAAENNLKDIDVRFPLGAVRLRHRGLGGRARAPWSTTSSTPPLARALHGSDRRGGRRTAGSRASGRSTRSSTSTRARSGGPRARTPPPTPRSSTSIRDFFAELPEARMHGYTPGRFSFNVKGGRCEACEGDGVKRVEMHFLARRLRPLRGLPRAALQRGDPRR